jgi:hypothetical protein
MLGMAFFKSLVKQHGVQFFEPVGKALAAAGIKKLSPANPAHLWALRRVLPPYVAWLMAQKFSFRLPPKMPKMPAALRKHAERACRQLPLAALEISGIMRKHQLKLADRQLRMSEVSLRVQKLVTMLCASLYAAEYGDEVVQSAADILCQDLDRELTGRRPSDLYFRAVTELGQRIAAGGFASIAGLESPPILMPYES